MAYCDMCSLSLYNEKHGATSTSGLLAKEDNAAPPVPPLWNIPRKRQPITISKRPARVYNALSHDHFQHTDSNCKNGKSK